ncbi:phosphatidylinositol polyphosphate 5-phosphatase type IV-like [Ornithodoros turicata]|uniref:phosphatidylinositol polyphosphate 5-phosphatase type IV-like n=1 Tax=Ornithodoros turicata TaxID=34597 RepID=UPI003138679C
MDELGRFEKPPVQQNEECSNSTRPTRPSRLTSKKSRMKGKKSQSLPVIKTPLEGMRLIHGGLCGQGSAMPMQTSADDLQVRSSSLSQRGSATSSPKDSCPPSPTDDEEEFFSDEEFHRVDLPSAVEAMCVTSQPRRKSRLVRLSSMVKCPSSGSLNRPLALGTEQLLRQTSRVSTGSLKSLSPSEGSNGNGGKPLHLPPIARILSPAKDSRRDSIGKKLQHSWTITGVSQYQDSFDSVVDKESVLPKILTKDARLRSYLVGNVSGKGSLLGEEELNRYFPSRKVEIFVATWNMNGQAPQPNLDDFLLPDNIEHVPDIYAVGVQEAISDRKEWETRLQFTLGPSHVLFHSVSLGVLHLCVFLRRDLLWFCSAPEESTYATRPVSSVKTKGAVSLAFQFFGSSLLFINSHLTAHDKKFKERIQDYEKICHTLDLPKQMQVKLHYQSKDVTARFDHVFWCGDLNFRIMSERPSVVELLRSSQPREAVYEKLLKLDQLKNAMTEGRAFFGFQEGKINFGPTYKFEVGSRQFDKVKLRVPSYTDRILFRSRHKTHIECIFYGSVTSMQTSDHRPVYGLYHARVKSGRDNIRLAAGFFNRDVYLEAIRRRAAALEIRRKLKASQICSVM